MSAASDLLRQFDAIGARVENRAGRLVLRPGSQPIPLAMVAAAKLAKEDVLAAISGPKAPTPEITEPNRTTAPARVSVMTVAGYEPVLLRDGRRLWRFRAETIPEFLNDDDIRPAVEARWLGCVLMADGHELLVVEPWLSNLPDETRAELAANAGTVIALLRGESRVRNGAVPC
jgi:hypothetical protein